MSDETSWSRSDDGEFGWLTSKGRAAVRKAIDDEKSRRFEVRTLWVTKIILPILTILIGVIGAITGIVAVYLRSSN